VKYIRNSETLAPGNNRSGLTYKSTMSTEVTRRPYTGSCHCGAVKYIAYVTLPAAPNASLDKFEPFTVSPIYKCNCSTCHKMGYFHLRFPDAPNDFLLLSPLIGTESAAEVLGDYRCNAGVTSWYFCKTCGVRTLALRGEGEIVDVDVNAFMGKEPTGETQKAWKPKKEGWSESPKNRTSYLSINAVTLDQLDDAVDLREWTERNWIAYVDSKHRKGEMRIGQPHPGGMY
jgi:hypothetical protein